MKPGAKLFNRPIYLYIVTPLISLFGIYSAFRLRWLCDDSFISFRYAKNFVDGLGLVFNRGEYVEGYTNFLWTMLVAFGMEIGIEPERSAIVLGLLCFIGILVFILRVSFLFQKKETFIPIAVAGYALHKHAQIFATSGLETSFYTLLLLSGAYYLLRYKSYADVLIAMPLLVFAAMTRPDGLLFYAIAGLYLLYHYVSEAGRIRFDLKLFLKYFVYPHLFFAFVFIPYWIWRYNYYGWPFPNTFYAKSGGGSYVMQGLRYFALYFQAYYLFTLIPVFLVVFYLKKKRGDLAGSLDRELIRRALILIVLPGLLYIAYYTKIGGDFMFSRFFIPITPFLFLIMEYLILKSLPAKLHPYALLAVIVMVVGFYNPYRGKPFPEVWGVVDENQVYKPDYVKKVVGYIKPWAKIIRGNDIRLAVGGTQAMFAYYLEPNYALEAIGGLTDEVLAHKKIEKRTGIVGHEKQADIEYMRKRKVNLYMNALFTPGATDYNQVTFKFLPGAARIVVYEAEKMKALSQIENLQYVRFEDYLSAYLKKMDRLPPRKVLADYLEFKAYYFDYNKDPARERMLGYLRRNGITVDDHAAP